MAATRITRGRLSPESEKFLDDVLEELRKSGASEEEINNASSGLTDAVFAASTKSPSPAFSSSSANANLSSVIGCPPALQVKVLQLHLSRSDPMTTSNSPPQPDTADRPKTPPRAWTLALMSLASAGMPRYGAAGIAGEKACGCGP